MVTKESLSKNERHVRKYGYSALPPLTFAGAPRLTIVTPSGEHLLAPSGYTLDDCRLLAFLLNKKESDND